MRKANELFFKIILRKKKMNYLADSICKYKNLVLRRSGAKNKV